MLQVLTICTLVWVGGTSAFEGLNCRDAAISEVFAANELETCPIVYPRSMHQLGTRKMAVLQMDRLVTRRVTKCRLEFRPHIWNCGYEGDHVIEAGAFASVKTLSEEECRTAASKGNVPLMNGKRLGGIKEGITTSSVNIYGGTDPTGSCHADTKFYWNNRQYSANMVWHVKFILRREKEVFNVETNTIVSSGLHCGLTDKVCIGGGYTIIQGRLSNKQKCPYSLTREALFKMAWADPLPDGVGATKEVTDARYRLMVSADPKLMLRFITYEATTVCGHRAVRTNFQGFYLVDASLSQYFKGVTLAGVSLPTQVDSKVFFLMGAREDDQKDLYLALQSKTCENKRAIIQNKLQLLRLLPPGKPGLVAHEPPIIALILGEVVYLLKCKLEEVQLRTTERCYAEIPVTHKGKKACLDPLTRVIQPDCRPLPCSRILRPAFKSATGQWITYGKTFSPMASPLSYPVNDSFIEWSWKELKTYAQGGIYNPSDVRDLMDLLHRTGRVETTTTVLTEHTQRNADGTYTLDADLTGIIVGKYKSALMRFFKTVQQVGNVISSFFGFYLMIIIIKYAFNRAVDIATFYNLMSIPLMCLTILCPAIARYRTGVEVHQRDRRGDVDQPGSPIRSIGMDTLQRNRRSAPSQRTSPSKPQ